ncbi:hypothetical protein L1965_05170 [Paracoccus sp. EGI L200073]|nr:hypothetical protein [Paracoccus salsus]
MAQRDAATIVGLALTGAWLLLVGLFWFLAPGGDGAAGGVTRLVAAMGVVLPLVLIWTAISLARSIALLRAESQDLRQRLGQLREYAATRRPPHPAGDGPRDTATGTQPAGQMSRPLPTATPQPAGARPQPQGGQPISHGRPRPTDLRQAAMRFDAPESIRVPPETLIRALNFPDGADDTQAISALRAALKDHDNSRVLRAAQDVVTLLAAQDIYMDDLPPDPAPVGVWRRFAEGQRGSAIAALGGIHDETAIEITAALLRSDEIFRDAAHHFLRHFDLLLTRLVSDLDDAQIEFLAQTRSARAFMLVGRVTGIFG